MSGAGDEKGSRTYIDRIMDARPPAPATTPGPLRLTEGGGCMSLFGLPFLAAGVFLVGAATGAVPFENAGELPRWAPGVFLAMGAVFGAVGGTLALGRRWTTLDRSRKTLVREWGLVVPMRSEERWIGDHEAVVLHREEGDSDSADTWPVALRTRSAGELPLSSGTDYAAARAKAEAVARYLGVPLVDATTPRPSEAAIGRVGASLGERLRDGDEAAPDFPRPVRPRSQVTEHRGSAEIVLPAPPFARGRLVLVAATGGVFAWAAPGILRFFEATGTPGGVQVAALGFIAFVFVVVPVAGALGDLLRSVRGGTVVTVSPEGIVIEERGAWRSRFTRIAAEDVLGLDHATTDDAMAEAWAEGRRRVGSRQRAPASGPTPPPTPSSNPPIPGGREPGWARAVRRLVPSKGVIVKTRSGLVPLGAGLPDDEVRWLHGVVARGLGGS